MEDNSKVGTYMDDAVIKRFRGELCRTRMICLVLAVLMVLVLVGGGFFFRELRLTREQMEPLVEQISALNMDELNLTLEEINETLETVDWDQVAQAIESLDVDALNTAIENLDTKELSEALAKLNDAVDALGRMRDSLKQMLPFL